MSLLTECPSHKLDYSDTCNRCDDCREQNFNNLKGKIDNEEDMGWLMNNNFLPTDKIYQTISLEDQEPF